MNTRKLVKVEEIENELMFVRNTARHFNKHPEHYTFGEAEANTFFAVRWGLFDDCLLVFKIGGNEPKVYTDMVKRKI